MRQKHLCGVFHCCRFRIWNACHICSSLWPEMGERLVHLWEQCLVTAGASGHCWCRMCGVPASLYPRCHVPHCLPTAGTGGHQCLCSTLSSFVLKALRSLIIFEEGIFTGGWLLPTCCLWDQGLVFHAYGQQILGCSAAGRLRHEAREHLVLRGLCAVGWWDPFPWVFIPVSQTWWRC